MCSDHSRVLTAARVCAGPTAAAAWDALACAISEWGAPAHVMSDNGTCFTARFTAGTESDFERSLRGLGIRHIPSSPGHPQTCGKLERSHQTTKRWLRAVGPAASPEHLQAQLDSWRAHYNEHRPHRAAKGRTPLQRWQATPRSGPAGASPPPTRASLHTIDRAGKFGWGRYTIGIDSRRAGQQVLVIAHGDDLVIHGQGGILRSLTVDPARRHQPTGIPRGPRQDLLSAMSR